MTSSVLFICFFAEVKFDHASTSEILRLWNHRFRTAATDSRCVVSRSGQLLQFVRSEDAIRNIGLISPCVRGLPLSLGT